MMALATAQYLLALAVELIGKAYFLKVRLGPREGIYTHTVSDLIAKNLLNAHQSDILRSAEESVVWAGRYPTPKWTKEDSKERYDVPAKVIEGVEHIDASAINNSASPHRCNEFLELFNFMHQAWSKA